MNISLSPDDSKPARNAESFPLTPYEFTASASEILQTSNRIQDEVRLSVIRQLEGSPVNSPTLQNWLYLIEIERRSENNDFPPIAGIFKVKEYL